MIKVHVTVRRAMTVLSLDCHCGSIEEEKKPALQTLIQTHCKQSLAQKEGESVPD